ncbi:hypothetical protein [Devosia nitrariae]|uniref:hypothetical protein n=1 Tax=Devosia nitrariae TaxID=2071872 RepID=UPI0024E15F90|nr:hypothetical protein [Devosia nitrariae]
MHNISRIAFTLIAGLGLALPAHAASRTVQINADIFASRCAAQGGMLQSDGATYFCQTPAVEMLCKFVAPSTARCAWPGIDNTRAVVRLIGMNTNSAPPSSGAGAAYKPDNGGGGIDVPDLPIDNGGGGGGIDLPDLPIDNGNGGGGGIDVPDLPVNNN